VPGLNEQRMTNNGQEQWITTTEQQPTTTINNGYCLSLMLIASV